MKAKIKEMIDTINLYISMAYNEYQDTHKYNAVDMAKINGMITMLAIATGKDYLITANGVVER